MLLLNYRNNYEIAEYIFRLYNRNPVAFVKKLHIVSSTDNLVISTTIFKYSRN